MKPGGVGDDMVRRGDEHNGLRVMFLKVKRGGEDGGGRIAPFGLNKDRTGINPNLEELFGDDKTEIRIG